MKFDYLKLAEIIKERRIELGISTRKLAEKIGISHAEISRFENGLKPGFYFIPFIKLCKELDLDIEVLLKVVGLLEEKEDKKYVVRVVNADEDFFEINAKNEYEAAKIVSKFVIQNDIIDLDFNKKFEVEVEEIDEENEEISDEECEELEEDSFMKMQCENCKYHCPYCGECTLGE